MSTTTEGLPSGCSYAHLSHPGSAARRLAGETAQPLTHTLPPIWSGGLALERLVSPAPNRT